VVETDCAELVKALGSTDTSWSRWAGLISEIKEASQLLPEWRFVHVKREANQVAHGLAKLATTQQQCMVMRLSVSPGIQALVDRDVLMPQNAVSSCNSVPP
jgi:hypothetical protein